MKHDPRRSWTSDEIHGLIRGFQASAVLAAAAELDVFTHLDQGPLSAPEIADRLGCNLRGLTALLNALAALGLLNKEGDRYSLAGGVAEVLTPHGRHTGLAMARHQANCLRNWSELARVIKSGRLVEKRPSIRGVDGDREAFIGAMDNVSGPVADEVVRRVRPLAFNTLLDVGGASGTWTLAFLRACPGSSAVIFDLPPVIPLAKSRVEGAGMCARVRYVAGDFESDPLPGGADLVWVSAIVHQNSRAQNRDLFAKAFSALLPGGRIAIRDIVMDDSGTRPVSGALFAINMLVATPGGGTFSLRELGEDLKSAGFAEVDLAYQDDGMSSIVTAVKPAGS